MFRPLNTSPKIYPITLLQTCRCAGCGITVKLAAFANGTSVIFCSRYCAQTFIEDRQQRAEDRADLVLMKKAA